VFLISLLVLISSTLVLFCSFFLLYISVFRFSCILMCIWLLAARCGEIKFICIAFRPTYTKLQMYRTFPPGHISPDNFPPHLIPQQKFGNKLISRWDRRTLPAQPRRRRKLYHPYSLLNFAVITVRLISSATRDFSAHRDFLFCLLIYWGLSCW